MTTLMSDSLAFVRASLPQPPARVLEVGAGRGAMASALAGLGYDVVAIDPAADAPHVLPIALLDVAEPDGSFDAAVAVVSLHHVDPLPESMRKLADLVRPGGRLAIDELDVERFDERAARWLMEQWDAIGREHAGAAAEIVDRLRGHVHPVQDLVDSLAPYFELGEPVRGPYLHRWDLEPGLRDAEERLIAAGELPATGVRLVATRRAAAGG